MEETPGFYLSSYRYNIEKLMSANPSLVRTSTVNELVPAPFPGEHFLARREGMWLELDNVATHNRRYIYVFSNECHVSTLAENLISDMNNAKHSLL